MEHKDYFDAAFTKYLFGLSERCSIFGIGQLLESITM